VSKVRRAFTLIELLVVIAIIAILAAILFPVFARAKFAAKKSVSVSNLKQMSLARQMYGEDYDGMLCSITVGELVDKAPVKGVHPTPGSKVRLEFADLLHPYIKNDGLFFCPLDIQARPSYQNGKSGGYGLNWVYFANFARVLSFSSVEKPAETIEFTPSSTTGSPGGYYATGGLGGPANNWAQYLPKTLYDNMMPLSWLDGHVSTKHWNAFIDDSRNANLTTTTAPNGANPAPANPNKQSFWDLE
jgi:prepilin-type N-terminal cleavage/methylation domain-containing protein